MECKISQRGREARHTVGAAAPLSGARSLALELPQRGVFKVPVKPTASILPLDSRYDAAPQPVRQRAHSSVERGSAQPKELNRKVRLVVLSGADLYNFVPEVGEDGVNPFGGDYCRFVFDIDSLLYNDRLIIDYNHDPETVIGALDSVGVVDGQLVGEGKIVPFTPNDKAAEVAYMASFVPYGVSPLVAFDDAEAIDVKKGETFKANGTEYEGPIVVFRKARILGVAVCPYPTDEKTSVTALKRSDVMSILELAKEDEKKKKSQMIDETEEQETEQEEAGDDAQQSDLPDTPGDGGDGGGTPQGTGNDDGDETGDGDGDTTPDGGGGTDPPENPQENGKAEDAIAQLVDAVSKLREEFEKDREERRECLAKLTTAAKHVCGAEPVGFSGNGKEMSYEEAVSARLDKLQNKN